MIVPGTALLHLMDWIVKHLGFNLDLGEGGVVGPIDEWEILEQLQFGRD
jgi:hypothetical protein